VRAASVSTLGVFATRVPELRPSVSILLQRSLGDEDDEVRDRAAIILSTLSKQSDESELKFLLDEPLPMSFASLERSVRALQERPLAGDKLASLATLPIIEESYTPNSNLTNAASKKKKASAALSGELRLEPADPAASVYKVPELASLGRAFRSTGESALTEEVMEYVVSCVKHVFESHVVLEFLVLNTIDDQRLKDVFVEVEVEDEEAYIVEHTIPAAVARYGDQTRTFVSLARQGDVSPASLKCSLHFKVVQVDPATGEVEGDENGYDEEYPLEDLELTTSDFMAKTSVGDFRRAWDQTGSDGEVLEKFALQFKKLEDAVVAVTDFLGMQPVDGTGVVPAGDGPRRSHTLHLSGMFLGNVSVLARAQLQMEDTSGAVVLKIAVRSENKDISQLVAECIR